MSAETPLIAQLVEFRAEFRTWSNAVDASLSTLHAEQKLTNNEVRSIAKDVAVAQTRIARHSEELAHVGEKLNVTEISGVYDRATLEGRKSAWQTLSTSVKLSLAVLGGMTAVGGLIIGIVKLCGCG